MVSIDLTVGVSVTNSTAFAATGITGVPEADFAAAESPALYLGVEVGQEGENDNAHVDVFAQNVADRKVVGSIAGNADNFEITEEAIGSSMPLYKYTAKHDADLEWQAIDVYLEGAVKEFDVEDGLVAPNVQVTWSYAEHAEVDAFANTYVTNDYVYYPEIVEPALTNTNTGIYGAANDVNGDGELVVAFDYGTYDRIFEVWISADDGDTWTNITDRNDLFTIDDEGAIVFNSSYMASFVTGEYSRTFSVSFESDEIMADPVNLEFIVVPETF